MKKGLEKLTLLVLSTCLAGVGFGQTSGAGTITGSIKDATGASVPGAAVVVKNADTGSERSLQTNDSGIYVAPFTPSDHYETTTNKQGFGKVARQGLTLQVGQIKWDRL